MILQVIEVDKCLKLGSGICAALRIPWHRHHLLNFTCGRQRRSYSCMVQHLSAKGSIKPRGTWFTMFLCQILCTLGQRIHFWGHLWPLKRQDSLWPMNNSRPIVLGCSYCIGIKIHAMQSYCTMLNEWYPFNNRTRKEKHLNSNNQAT